MNFLMNWNIWNFEKQIHLIFQLHCFSGSSAAKKKNQVSVKSITQHQVKVPGLKGKVTTASLHKLLPEDEQKLKDLEQSKIEEKHKAL